MVWQPHAIGQGPAASAPSPWTGGERKIPPPPPSCTRGNLKRAQAIKNIGGTWGRERERSFKGWGRSRRGEGLTGKRRVVDLTLTKERFPPQE